MRLAGRQWSLLLRSNGTTIVKLNTGSLRRRFPSDVEAGGSALSVAKTGQSTFGLRSSLVYEQRRNRNE